MATPLPLRAASAAVPPESTRPDVVTVISSNVEQRKSWGRSRLSGKISERSPSFPAYYTAVRAVQVRTVDDLAHVFNTMSPLETVIRAAFKPGADPERFRRAIDDDPDRGPGAFIKLARSWVLFDFDSLGGDQWDKPTDDEDFDTIAEALRELLPPAFHTARCHWRRSGSNGFKPWFKNGKFNARMHLVFMLSSPLTEDQLKTWTLSSGCDRATLHPTTPHFVVPPDLDGHDGLESVQDPFSVRTGFISGDTLRVEVPENLPQPIRLEASVAPVSGPDWATALSPVAFAKMRDNVVSHTYAEIAAAAKGEHHNAIVKQGYLLSRLVPSGLLTADEVLSTIVGAAEAHYSDANHPKVGEAHRSTLGALAKMDSGVFHPLRVGDLPSAYVDKLGFGSMRQMAYYQDVGEHMSPTGTEGVETTAADLAEYTMPQALHDTKRAYQGLFETLVEEGVKLYLLQSTTLGGGVHRILHEAQGVSVKPVSVTDMALLLMQHVNLHVWQAGKGDADDYVRPARQSEVKAIARDLLEMSDPMIPLLKSVISSPQFRPDGSVITEPGYDVVTQLFFDCTTAAYVLPNELERNDGLRAIEDLRCLLSGFPFDSEVDFAVVLAGYLSAIAKPMIAGPCPMFMITAPSAGTGKSKLVRIAAAISDGTSEPKYIQAYADPEETRKQITSALMGSTRTVMSWDNVRNGAAFGNQYLAQLATSMLWADRGLNTNTSMELSIMSVFWVTGNNILPADDMQRRCLVCTLDAKMENPERRVFSGDPPELEAIQLRNPLAISLITILKAYLAAGKPKQKGSPFGSFETWARVVRDALLWYDLPDVASTISTTKQNDPTQQAKRAFLVSLKQWFGDTPFDTADLIAIYEGRGTSAHLGKFARGNTREEVRLGMNYLCKEVTVRNVGYMAREMNGQVVGGLSLKRTGSTKRTGRWVMKGTIPAEPVEVTPE